MLSAAAAILRAPRLPHRVQVWGQGCSEQEAHTALAVADLGEIKAISATSAKSCAGGGSF